MNKAIFLATQTSANFEAFAKTLEVFGKEALVHLVNPEDFLTIPPEREPCVCLIDAMENQAWALEWTQTLRITYEKLPIIVFHEMGADLDLAIYKKNGADHFMHFFFDQEFIVDLIIAASNWDFGAQIPLVLLQSIHPDDISQDVELSFDVFAHLPHNKKTIKLRKKGDILKEETVSNVVKHGQSIYFKKSDQTQFAAYAKASQAQKKTGGGDAMTIKEMNAKKIFYEFMSEFFDASSSFDSGKKILQYCKQIVADMGLLEERSNESWSELIVHRSGREIGFYQHALNMAYLGAIFGHFLGLKKDKIESLALAGLLHNIGLSKVHHYGAHTPLDSLSDVQKKQYYSYPNTSSTMVKLKKVSLVNDVNDVILQHRERPDGKGFPNGLVKDKLSDLTFPFQIALRFEELTCLGEIGVKRTPGEAMEYLKNEVLAGREFLDMVMVMTLVKKIKK